MHLSCKIYAVILLGCALWCTLFWICRTPPMEPLAIARWLALCTLGCIGITAACIDWKSEILPDILTLWCAIPFVAVVVLLNVLEEYFHGAANFIPAIGPLAGSLLGFGLLKPLQLILRRHTGEEQLGSGDVKLMLGLGGLTGPTGVLPTLFLAILIILVCFKSLRHKRLPFGPSLTTAAIVVVLAELQWPF